MKLAAIDIGSNAARLLIDDVTPGTSGKPEFTKLILVRVPLRLGFDVFEQKNISPERIAKFVKTMQAFQLLMQVYEVDEHIACATSAMRDAANAAEVLATVEKKSGLKIKVITGDEEANLIYENHIAENMNAQTSYLYIDVGGGSTELSFFTGGALVAKQSFNIGTIRLLKEQVTQGAWQEMKAFIQKKVNSKNGINCIGSGGNINKIFSLSKRKEGKPLTLDLLHNYYKEFSAISLQQRMQLYKLREDRADVIVPALLIYINVMRWTGAEEIYVPKIGLADGLIHHLYDSVVLAEAKK